MAKIEYFLKFKLKNWPERNQIFRKIRKNLTIWQKNQKLH